MQEPSPGWNPETARIVIIAVFVVVSLLVRAAKAFGKRGSSENPLERFRRARESVGQLPREPLGLLRQGRAILPTEPVVVKPESALLPSLLLVVLFVCLVLMAWLRWG